MTDRLSPQRETEINAALASYVAHPDLGFACCSAHGAADAAQELLAELAAVRAERDEARAELAKARSDALRQAARGAHIMVHASAAEAVYRWLSRLAEAEEASR